jgi:hypothetical protein
MIKLKNLLLENDDDDDDKIDVDRLWNDSYLDQVAEKLGYNRDFNNDFWRLPQTLFHCTPEQNAAVILQQGLKSRSATRGINNRSVGSAIFTTMAEEEVDSVKASYGPCVFAIDTSAMKKDGVMLPVEKEPEWERAEKMEFVYRRLGHEDAEASRFVDSSDGTSPYTVIVYGSIPPKYLKRIE